MLQNYANDVVAALLDACVVKGVRQPVIASESGRALASHSAVLVFDVLNDSENAESDALRNLQVLEENKAPGLGSIKQGWPPKTDGLATNGLQPARRDPGQYLLSTFYQVFATIDQSNFQVCWNLPICARTLGAVSNIESTFEGTDVAYETRCIHFICLCDFLLTLLTLVPFCRSGSLQ